MKRTAAETQISIRLPVELLERAEALVPALRREDQFLGFSISRGTVLRLALIRGLRSYEQELGKKPKRK